MLPSGYGRRGERGYSERHSSTGLDNSSCPDHDLPSWHRHDRDPPRLGIHCNGCGHRRADRFSTGNLVEDENPRLAIAAAAASTKSESAFSGVCPCPDGKLIGVPTHDSNPTVTALPTVVGAPDSFKGTMSADVVADALAAGVRDAGGNPLIVALADGGEGTADVVPKVLAARIMTIPTTGPWVRRWRDRFSCPRTAASRWWRPQPRPDCT